MKNFAKGLLLTMLVLFLFAACSNNDEKVDKEPDTQKDPDTDTIVEPEPEPEEITLLWSLPMNEEMFIEQFKNPVEEQFPHITIEHINLDSNALEEAFAANLVPDIIQHASHVIHQIVDYGIAYDMTELIEKHSFDLNRIDQGAIEFAKSQSPDDMEGALLSIPFLGIAHALFYNKDLFDQFGVEYPEDGITWSETLDLARRLTVERDGVQYRGLHLEHPFRATDQLEAAPIDRETGEVMFDKDDRFHKVLNMIKEFGEIPGNYDSEVGLTWIDPFLSGTTAMVAAADGAIHYMLNPDNNVTFNWDLVTWPVWEERPTSSPPNAERQNLAITSTSEYKDEAFEVIAFLLSDEHQAWRAANGYSPTVLVNPDVQSQYLANQPAAQEKNIAALFKHTPATRHIQPPGYPTTRLFTTEMMEFLNSDHRDVNVYLRELTERSEGRIADYQGRN